MKIRACTVLLLLMIFGCKLQAQNSRWMFLAKSSDGITYLVDTVTNDTKQMENYDGHQNVVMVWVKTVQTKHNKKGSYIETAIAKFAVDTGNNQEKVTSLAIYHGNNLIRSENDEFGFWNDVIPESMGEYIAAYCRALYNQELMDRLVNYAELHERSQGLKRHK